MAFLASKEILLPTKMDLQLRARPRIHNSCFTMCRASWGCTHLKAMHSLNACVVRPDSSALWRGSSARRFVTSKTTEMLRGRNVVGGGVTLTVSARVRSLPWEDALKMVARCGAPRGVHPHAG